MPLSLPEFESQLTLLKGELAAQGRSVQSEIEAAVDAIAERNPDKARWAVEHDHEIDREDVRIERAAVALLARAMESGIVVPEADVRLCLTLVKVNNELERIADCAVMIAERMPVFAAMPAAWPAKFLMMANSVIGIMQTTNIAFDQMDRIAAEVVLASDDATEAFKQAILRDTLDEFARGTHKREDALALLMVAANLGRIADHCTNIVEQVIYASTGKVVRHEGDRWMKPEDVQA